MIEKAVTFLKNMLLRNLQTLGSDTPKQGCVTLEYYQGEVNIGDQLAPVIFEWMMKRLGLTNRCKGIKHLNTVGSLIGLKKYDAVIWGSGILTMGFAKSIFKYGKMIKYDVRAVRGPITHEILTLTGHASPGVFGDPGVLMPLIYQPTGIEKCYDVSIIHHFFAVRFPDDDDSLHKISVATDDYRFFIDEILKSRLVLSSSLHGIILAEAYGVPAIFLCEGMDASMLKFMDWYHSTGRTEIKIAHSIQEALTMEPMPLPELASMQQELIDAFPRDIFC